MPETLIPHPKTGQSYYGVIEQRKLGKLTLQGGNIVLKVGKHSPNGGFGEAHIWARHSKDIIAAGFDNVATYVAYIIQDGSPIYCEFNNIRDTRVTVVRSKNGAAVLEYREPFYSVVTAFSPKNVHGTRVGSVKGYKGEAIP